MQSAEQASFVSFLEQHAFVQSAEQAFLVSCLAQQPFAHFVEQAFLVCCLAQHVDEAEHDVKPIAKTEKIIIFENLLIIIFLFLLITLIY